MLSYYFYGEVDVVDHKQVTTKHPELITTSAARPTERFVFSATPTSLTLPHLTMDLFTSLPSTTTALSLLALLPILYLYTALSSSTFPTLRSTRILLLIAHPDDEAMFLSPCLTRLTDPALNNAFRILCLSSGNADGIGDVRRKELKASARILGDGRIGEGAVEVLDDKELPDSMQVQWSEKHIADLLIKTYAPALAGEGNGKRGKAAGSAASARGRASDLDVGVDVIITFDSRGVSSHPNHISCHLGALAFLDALMAGREGWACPVDVYTLTSVPIWRKYMSVMDLLFTVLAVMLALTSRGMKAKAKGRKKEAERERPSVLFFVSGPGEWWRGIRAMTEAHISQMRWFRWGWIGLSRYMVMNDLRRVGR